MYGNQGRTEGKMKTKKLVKEKKSILKLIIKTIFWDMLLCNMGND